MLGIKEAPALIMRINDIWRKGDRKNDTRKVVGAGAFRSYDGD
jgi:hypothetical protein